MADDGQPIRLRLMVDVGESDLESALAAVDAAAGKTADRITQRFADASAKAVKEIEKIAKALESTGLGGEFNRVAAPYAAGVQRLRTSAAPATQAQSPYVSNEALAQYISSRGLSPGAVSSAMNPAAWATTGNAMSLAFHPVLGTLTSVKTLVDGVGDSFVKLSGIIYSLKNVGAGLRESIAAPLEAIIGATEDYKKFQLAISGTVGGMDKAQQVDEALQKVARDVPLTIAQLRMAGEEMARIVELSPQLALGSPQQIGSNIGNFSRIVGQLSALNPQASPEQITQTLGVALQGQFNTRTFRRQLGIDPNELARMEGMKPTDLAADPQRFLDALTQYLNRMTGTAGSRGDLVSVAYAKLKDDFTLALQKVGESGLYDQLTNRLKKVAGTLLDYVESPDFGTKAKATSDALGSILDNVGDSALRLLQSLSGASDAASTPAAVADQIKTLADTIAKWSKELPGLASDAGKYLRDLGGELESFVSRLEKINAMAARPGDALQGFADSYVDDKWLRIDPEERKRRQLEQIRSALVSLGIKGANVDDYTTTSSTFFGLATSIDHSYQLSTRGIRDPRQAMLAEKLANALEAMDPNALQNPAALFTNDQVLAAARQAIPGFDEKLKNTTASPQPIGGYRYPAGIQSALNALHDTSEGDPFAAKFRAAQDAAVSIGQYAPDSDPLTKTFSIAHEKITTLMGSNGLPDVLDRLKDFSDEVNQRWAAAASALRAEMQNDPAHAADLMAPLKSVETRMAQLSGDYTKQADELAKALRDAVGNFGVELAKELKSAPASYAAEMLNRYVGGDTLVQQRIGGFLGKHGFDASLGFDNLPIGQRSAFLDETTAANMRMLQEAGAFGGMIRPGMSAAEIVAQARHPLPDVGSLLAGPGVANLQLDYIQNTALPLASKNYNSLRDQFNQLGPDADPAQLEKMRQALDAAGESVAKLAGQMTQLQLKTNVALSGMAQFADSAKGALENSLGATLTALETKGGKVTDIFRNLAHEVLADFNNIMMKELLEAIIGGIVRGIAGSAMSSGAFGAADGAIFGGGIRFFSSGGMVQAQHPLIGIVGEGQHDEAIIPMPDGHVPLGMVGGQLAAMLPGGRSIPARFGMSAFAAGGTAAGGFTMMAPMQSTAPGFGNGGNIYVVHSPEEAFLQGMRAHKDTLVNLVTGNIVKGGRVAKAIRRGPSQS